MPAVRYLMRGALLVTAACVIAACGGTGGSGQGADGNPATGNTASGGTVPSITDTSGAAPGGGYPASAWPEFGQNAARTGVAPDLPRAGKLGVRWRAKLDGAVYGQPLAVGGDVIAATENDTVYALDASTGRVAWSRHVGSPVPESAQHGCGDIFPLGITGTPVYDRANGLVYAVAETTGYRFTLYGLSINTGTVKVRRDFDLATSRNDPAWDQQRPALTINQGRVYADFGGLDGDCGPYVGRIAGIPLDGKGAQVTFATPTTREGAIWATAGPVTAPGGDLWISIGNGAASGPPYDGSDSVTELTPGLARKTYFAPGTWADDNAGDHDLGSTQPALVPGNEALIVGKRGTGYLLDTREPGGVGGQIAEGNVCPAYGAAAVGGSVVYEPCRHGGTAAVEAGANPRDTNGGSLRVLWRGPAGADGSPVLGGGALWVTGYDSPAGVLYELDPATGKPRQEIGLGDGLPHFSSLSLANGTAYVSTLSGIVAVRGA